MDTRVWLAESDDLLSRFEGAVWPDAMLRLCESSVFDSDDLKSEDLTSGSVGLLTVESSGDGCACCSWAENGCAVSLLAEELGGAVGAVLLVATAICGMTAITVRDVPDSTVANRRPKIPD